MRLQGAECSTRLLLTVSWLFLMGLQSTFGANITATQEPGLASAEGTEGEDEGESKNQENEVKDQEEEAEEDTSQLENVHQSETQEDGSNMKVVKEVEFGMCTVTCGIGIREVILTNGCPGDDSKCIVRVEECRGPVDCGWGKPISESFESVQLACIHTSPENRFKFVWKILRPEQQPVVLANDTAILEVHRQSHPLAFECDTFDNNEIVASIKFTVSTSNELHMRRSRQPDTDAILVFVLTIGVVLCIFVIFVLIFIIINWTTIKTVWGTKAAEGQSELGSVKHRDSPAVGLSSAEPSGHEDEALSELNE